MSELLHFAEHRLQEVALCIMATVYILRIRWLLSFKAGKDRQAPTGSLGGTPPKGILYSWANVAMPWAMESTRRKFGLYVQFVLFHLAVTSAIALSFVIPYVPRLLDSPILIVCMQALIGAGFLVGIYRIYRRVSDPYMRAISSPDDYFCLILLTGWFALAFFAVPNRIDGGEGLMLSYFFVTAFFLIYVPFSKISHYLYYPFTRYYFGKSMGHRGVYPLRRLPEMRGAGGAR
jgi:nitrate reductase gamma subunit